VQPWSPTSDHTHQAPPKISRSKDSRIVSTCSTVCMRRTVYIFTCHRTKGQRQRTPLYPAAADLTETVISTRGRVKLSCSVPIRYIVGRIFGVKMRMSFDRRDRRRKSGRIGHILRLVEDRGNVQGVRFLFFLSTRRKRGLEQ
jgi:hypothetical protein